MLYIFYLLIVAESTRSNRVFEVDNSYPLFDKFFILLMINI